MTDVNSGLQASGKTDFLYIFVFSYKQCTFVPFLDEFISSRSDKMTEKSVFCEA